MEAKRSIEAITADLTKAAAELEEARDHEREASRAETSARNARSQAERNLGELKTELLAALERLGS
jgi:chromosome segregation ATPase